MRTIAGYLFGAILLALLATLSLVAGRLERDMARGQQRLVALDYEEPDQALETAERYLEYGSRLPWMGESLHGSLHDVQARRAALRYWQRQYGTIVPRQPDPVGGVAADNIELQLVVANAVYRAGEAVAKDRQTTLQALDAGIQAYLGVLKNSPRQQDAAYNYEYLNRLRDDLLKGRRKPGLPHPDIDNPHGRAGGPPPESPEASKLKIYIPLESEEREKAGQAGRGAPVRRKG